MKQLILAFLQGQVSKPINGFYINSSNELRYIHQPFGEEPSHIVVAKLYKGRFMRDLCAINIFRPQHVKGYDEFISILKDTAKSIDKHNVFEISYYDKEVSEAHVAETIECMVKEYNALVKCFMSKGTQMPEIFEMAVTKYNVIMAYCDATSSSTPHGMVSITKAKYKYDDITNF